MQLIRWPEEAAARRRCSEEGGLCLLVVEPHVPPPFDLTDGEDWVRSTADPMEVRSRIDRLRRLWVGRTVAPTVDDDAILTFGERWVALPWADLPLARLCCARFGSIVTRDELRHCFDPPCSNQTLAVKLHRFRRHVAAVGLRVSTIRGRGCVLEPELPAAHALGASGP